MAAGNVAAGPALTRTLARAARAVTASVEQVLKPEGLTFEQWLVVETLAAEGSLAMADLAERTMTTGPTLTRLVDRLVTTALLYREVDPADRRKILVYLSRRGQTTHRRIAPKVTEVERSLLVDLKRSGDILEALENLAER
ncbi:MarR family transcriptional regulator [Saccharopolyspora sp. K220]|uniref:MarR family winged helix-turn-helix transcriptional regulator n=1 Tax=Saccharopolyspora soli TaxID=2926618 RepID=UPI001F598E96|nr:MarR family transcriptional regulator [Saccharopolyspora soli]MCI2418337.1 MarR family transcriptional regulator [Saccharopolyspora soli]